MVKLTFQNTRPVIMLSLFGVLLAVMALLVNQLNQKNLSPSQTKAVAPPNCIRAGVNPANFGPMAHSFYDHEGTLNMGYTLEMAMNAYDVNNIGDNAFGYALDHGITPILRICYGTQCEFQNPADYVTAINSLADKLAGTACADPTSAACIARTFYAIAGPNEPLQDTWLSGSSDPAVAGPIVANYMNAVINGVNRPNVKLLSPSFNTTEPNFESLVSAMVSAGAQFDKLDGIAANAYDLPDGGSIGQWVSRLESIMSSANMSGKGIFFTEIGMLDNTDATVRPVALQNLANQVQLLLSHSLVKGFLLFNAFGTSSDPNFAYNIMTDSEINTVLGGGCYQEPTASPSPSPSPSPTATDTVTPSPSPSPTSTDTVTPSPSPSPTATDTVTPSPSPSPTATATVTPSPSPSPTATNTVTPSPTPSVPTIACGVMDVTGDGYLTLLDFIGFAQVYQSHCNDSPPTTGCGPRDVNGDKVINLLDFIAFSNKYSADKQRRCDL